MSEELDFSTLAESVDIECKAAQGKNGRGEAPAAVWESYSAMANTYGGQIFLGVSEPSKGQFEATGIQDIEKVRKSLWDVLNSNMKVNRNLLTESDISVLIVQGKPILRISVPQARRQDKPIHLNPKAANPFGFTYVRRHEGDYKADDDLVKRMIAESLDESRDEKFLENFSIEDLELETVSAYRNRFASVKPTSPWLDLSNEQFLVKIGAMGVDRTTGKAKLRLAGLLMFGRHETIKDALPNYMVDYQERPEAKTELRWVDRIVPDGTWSGNLYDFFLKVYRKITSDLKVPFRLVDGVRQDETMVHEALREALTNALIHADFSGRASILVVKRPDLFGFRNPGLMRLSVEQARAGGLSDCRNRYLQSMFRYIGLGDQAGSGVPLIYKSWQGQHWRRPILIQDTEYDLTLLELRMSSLLPEESLLLLDSMFGERFRKLPELENLILTTAATEGWVNHMRMKGISTAHPKDITAAFARLVQQDMLVKEGETRASIYCLPGERPSVLFQQSSPDKVGNSPDSGDSSPDKGLNSPDSSANSPDKDPIFSYFWEVLASDGFEQVPLRATPVQMKRWIFCLCDAEFVTLRELAKVLDRNTKTLQDQYLTEMVANGELELRYPDNRNHPEQAYRRAK